MKLWPARTQAVKSEPIIDLDSMVGESFAIRFCNKVHTIRPVRLDEFLRFTNAQAALMRALGDDQKLTPKDLAEKYLSVVNSVCDTITFDDILGAEQVQVAALYQLIIDTVTGQVKTGEAEKKRLRIPIYQYAVPSSSPNAPENLVGQSKKHWLHRLVPFFQHSMPQES